MTSGKTSGTEGGLARRGRGCLGPDGKPPPLRASKRGPWRAGVLVHLLVAVHVAHWLSSGRSLSPLEPSEAMEFAKHGLVNAGLAFFGLTILSTLVLGRWFCGWACHLVALQDLALWLLKKAGIRPKPLRSRALAWVPALAALYMFAYPFVFRLAQGEEIGVRAVEFSKADFWETFPPWPVALLTFVVCGFVTVYFLGAKGFCTYACPYGAVFGLVERFAVGRIRVTDACEGCGHCTATCSSNVIVHEEVRRFGMVVDSGCMKCLDCVSVCPKNALYFGLGRPSLGASVAPGKRARAGFTWSQELLLAALFVLALLAVRGLYGVVPFLLALALAALLAVGIALLFRLALAPSVSFAHWHLKRDGRLTRAGLWCVPILGLVTLLTAAGGRVGLRERWGALELACRHLRQGDGARFLGWLEAAAARSADPGLVHLELGRCHEAQGDGEAALAEYERSLAARPSVVAFDRLARLYWSLGRREKALALYERSVVQHPESADLHYNLGVARAELGFAEGAIRSFERTLELDPGRLEARENLAGLRARMPGGR
jgi:polyferredoxin